MPTNLEQLLRGLPARTCPAGLLEKIQQAINQKLLLKSLWRKVAAYTAGFLTLSGTLIVFRSYFWTEIAHSSFSVYLQVILSDYDKVLVYWKEMSLSLLESLPIVNVMAWSLLLFFGIGLLTKLFQIWSQSFNYHKHILTH